MSQNRPFRFGVEVTGASTADAWRATARAIEDMGYETLLVIDHLGDQFAPIPAMLAAADATTTLRVGSHVFANELRHPALLAKEAATVDLLTGGRLEFGIGAGWNAHEHADLGIAFPEPRVRVDRLAEAVSIVKGMLENESFRYSGRYYSVGTLAGLPRPVQQPRPPILIGGGGRRVLSLAAREADIVSLNPNLAAGDSSGPTAAGTMTAKATAAKVAWVRTEAGIRSSEPELSVRVYYTVITDSLADDAVNLATRMGMPAADILESPHCLVGDASRIAEKLQEFRDLYGITYFVITGDVYERFADVVSRLA